MSSDTTIIVLNEAVTLDESDAAEQNVSGYVGDAAIEVDMPVEASVSNSVQTLKEFRADSVTMSQAAEGDTDAGGSASGGTGETGSVYDVDDDTEIVVPGGDDSTGGPTGPIAPVEPVAPIEPKPEAPEEIPPTAEEIAMNKFVVENISLNTDELFSLYMSTLAALNPTGGLTMLDLDFDRSGRVDGSDLIQIQVNQGYGTQAKRYYNELNEKAKVKNRLKLKEYQVPSWYIVPPTSSGGGGTTTTP